MRYLLLLLFHCQVLLAKSVLVTGGAGFIGSHLNQRLNELGYETIVLDNLSTGKREAVQKGIFIYGDVGDENLLDHIFKSYSIDAVIHLASFLEVGESVANPLKYYTNNTANTIHLLNAMQRNGVNIIILSSSCTIFGSPPVDYISEETPCHPINPYGQSKLMIEQVLKDLSKVSSFRYSSLRYFNVTGGDPKGEVKNYKKQEATLIPVILHKIKNGSPTIHIFGTDYPTPDGTCVRDYIHVEDIVQAHILVMEKLFNGACSSSYNLGNNHGFSVWEVIRAVERVTGNKLEVIESPRRPGDPAILIADSTKAKRELKWEPFYSSLDVMVEHAWKAINE